MKTTPPPDAPMQTAPTTQQEVVPSSPIPSVSEPDSEFRSSVGVTQRDVEPSFARDTVSGPGTGSANSSRVYPYPFTRTGLHYDPQRFTCIPPSDDTSSEVYHNFTVEQAEAYWEPFDPQLQLSGCFFECLDVWMF